MNSSQRKTVLATLVYVFSPDEHVLMLHRNQNSEDFHFGKYNGLGGKIEVDEGVSNAAAREVFEESGIPLSGGRLEPRGYVHFPNFKPQKNEDWTVFLFAARLDTKPPLRQSAEGTLHWIPKQEVLSLPLWPGDQFFLPRLLAGATVTGTIWYAADGTVREKRFDHENL